MTDQERLEEIKSDWVNERETYKFRQLTLGEKDIDWLIETVEEQQKEIEFLNKECKKYSEAFDEWEKLYPRIQKESARLRKVLEFYADPYNYSLSSEAEKADLTEFINVLDIDNGDKARQVLEGSK